MFGFVFFVLVLLGGVGLILKGHTAVNIEGETTRVPLWLIGLPLVVIALLALTFTCIKTVGAREVGIPVTFGTIGADLQPGVHFLAPWTTIHKCSLGQQQSIMSDSPVTGDVSGHDGVNINGSDQGSAIADVSILYHFDPQHASSIYRKYACDATLVKQNLIRQATRGAVAQAAATIPSVDLRSNRAQIATASTPILQNTFKGDGILIDNVVISDILLSQSVQSAADAKLQAQQAAQQAQFALQKAQVDAQTVAVNANAEKVANDAKNVSLTPAVLCQQWINALAAAKPQVVETGGPCGGGTGGSGTIVQVK